MPTSDLKAKEERKKNIETFFRVVSLPRSASFYAAAEVRKTRLCCRLALAGGIDAVLCRLRVVLIGKLSNQSLR